MNTTEYQQLEQFLTSQFAGVDCRFDVLREESSQPLPRDPRPLRRDLPPSRATGAGIPGHRAGPAKDRGADDRGGRPARASRTPTGKPQAAARRPSAKNRRSRSPKPTSRGGPGVASRIATQRGLGSAPPRPPPPPTSRSLRSEIGCARRVFSPTRDGVVG